jgi:hypothetical protein
MTTLIQDNYSSTHDVGLIPLRVMHIAHYLVVSLHSQLFSTLLLPAGLRSKGYWNKKRPAGPEKDGMMMNCWYDVMTIVVERSETTIITEYQLSSLHVNNNHCHHCYSFRMERSGVRLLLLTNCERTQR